MLINPIFITSQVSFIFVFEPCNARLGPNHLEEREIVHTSTLKLAGYLYKHDSIYPLYLELLGNTNP